MAKQRRDGDRQGHWEHFDHGADIGLRAEAASKPALFELMAEALTAVVTPPQRIAPEIEIPIDCQAPDDALLLVDWLNALIYEMATRGLLFSAWQVSLEDHHLHGRARGQAVDRVAHEPAVEIKGATYTALEVRRSPDGRWHAQCVVDV